MRVSLIYAAAGGLPADCGHPPARTENGLIPRNGIATAVVDR